MVVLFWFLVFYCSPKVIDYNGYDVSVRELANSMKKEGYVLTHVMEIGILSIMMNLPADSKKVVMPLRFSVRKRTRSHYYFRFSIFLFLVPTWSFLTTFFCFTDKDATDDFPLQ